MDLPPTTKRRKRKKKALLLTPSHSFLEIILKSKKDKNERVRRMKGRRLIGREAERVERELIWSLF
jgi:hypothetical protein